MEAQNPSKGVMINDESSFKMAAAGKESSISGFFVKGRYKLCAVAVLSLLALWSMLTSTVSLRWSAGSIHRLSDDIDIPNIEDLDVLEMEEREKVVRHMLDAYTNGHMIRLPRFWQQAFEAAYEDLASDVPGVKESAISEIAKMSIGSITIESPNVGSKGVKQISDSDDREKRRKRKM